MDDSRQAVGLSLTAILLFIIGYLAIFFPFAYFRHDDWQMIGNSVLRLPQNWGSLFSVSIYDGGVEKVWFFRPFFKLSYFLGYQLFGFSYYGWLLSTLVLCLGAVLFGWKTVRAVTGSHDAAAFFVLFFTGNVHFHVGSLLWAGEGFMNVPSVFLLALSAYGFVRYLENTKAFLWQVLSLFTFILALGFKEASYAHILFLAGLYFVKQRKLLAKTEWLPFALIPHLVLTGSYLVIRLFKMPINPLYHPQISEAVTGVLYFTLAFLGPLFLVLLSFGHRWKKAFEYKNVGAGLFLLFLVLLLLPHQGHPFFSPGWLFYPGFFFSIILAFSIRSPQGDRIKTRGWVLVFGLSFLAVTLKMQSVEWWKWGAAQREMHQWLQSISPAKAEIVRVRDCSPLRVRPQRVLGNAAAVSDWYEALHRVPLNFSYVPCSTATYFDPTAIWYDWKFPHLVKSVD